MSLGGFVSSVQVGCARRPSPERVGERRIVLFAKYVAIICASVNYNLSRRLGVGDIGRVCQRHIHHQVSRRLRRSSGNTYWGADRAVGWQGGPVWNVDERIDADPDVFSRRSASVRCLHIKMKREPARVKAKRIHLNLQIGPQLFLRVALLSRRFLLSMFQAFLCLFEGAGVHSECKPETHEREGAQENLHARQSDHGFVGGLDAPLGSEILFLALKLPVGEIYARVEGAEWPGRHQAREQNDGCAHQCTLLREHGYLPEWLGHTSKRAASQ